MKTFQSFNCSHAPKDTIEIDTDDASKVHIQINDDQNDRFSDIVLKDPLAVEKIAKQLNEWLEKVE